MGRSLRSLMGRSLRSLMGRSLRSLMATAVAVSVSAAQMPTQYESVLAERNFMMPMRDGSRMATDIYRPARNGVAVSDRFPVLLHRTPYDKAGQQTIARYFAQHGYVVAVQDIRGRYKSEGKFLKVQPLDASDGYDAVEWMAKQPYSNGMVGMWGTSFAAHMEAGAAQLHPPSLKTIVVNMGGMSNAWDHGGARSSFHSPRACSSVPSGCCSWPIGLDCANGCGSRCPEVTTCPRPPRSSRSRR
jgi:predicted acyl esterase